MKTIAEKMIRLRELNQKIAPELELIEMYRQSRLDKIAVELDEIAELETQIKEDTIAFGESVQVDGVGRVTYRSGYDRVTWDNGKMSAFVAVYPVLETARKVSKTKPSASIKLED